MRGGMGTANGGDRAHVRPEGRKDRVRRLRRGLALALVGAAMLAALASSSAQASTEFGSVVATCNSITFNFKGFPNAEGNTVREVVKLRSEGVETIIYEGMFTFNGPEGSNTIPITVPPGPSTVDGLASWNTNGFKGLYDIAKTLNCSFPGFTIEKFQRIAGSGEEWTKEPVLGTVPETVEYKIVVKNTGNTKLTLENFVDKNCSNLTGGPSGPLNPGEETVYFCSHTLVPANLSASDYPNTATVTGDPPEHQGSKKTKKSNTVIVVFPKREHGTVEPSCKAITFRFTKFPNAENNTVFEKVTVDNVVVAEVKFTFNGPNGSNTIPLNVPVGHAKVDGLARWNTNGFKGGFDIAAEFTCPAVPAFGLQELGRVGQAPFTTGSDEANPGETVEYEVIATNEGNTPLTFGALQDPGCENIAGGPGATPVGIGESTMFTCQHTLTSQDLEGGGYDDKAELTGSYEATSISHTSDFLSKPTGF